jgi:hypothetical protein
MHLGQVVTIKPILYPMKSGGEGPFFPTYLWYNVRKFLQYVCRYHAFKERAMYVDLAKRAVSFGISISWFQKDSVRIDHNLPLAFPPTSFLPRYSAHEQDLPPHATSIKAPTHDSLAVVAAALNEGAGLNLRLVHFFDVSDTILPCRHCTCVPEHIISNICT